MPSKSAQPDAVRSPIRRCVACRRTAPKSQLLRFVRHPKTHQVLFDPQQKLAGRGAYLCPKTECLQHARRKGSLLRALKATPPRTGRKAFPSFQPSLFHPSQVGYKPTPPTGVGGRFEFRLSRFPACPLATLLSPICDSEVKGCRRSGGGSELNFEKVRDRRHYKTGILLMRRNHQFYGGRLCLSERHSKLGGVFPRNAGANWFRQSFGTF